MKKLVSLAVLMGISSLGIAQESSDATGIDLGIKGGTIGAGIDLRYSFSDALKLRLGYSKLEIDEDLEDTQATYDAEFDMTGASVLLDWHPFEGDFRLSGGFSSFAKNQITGSAVPAANQTITLNNTVYNAADLASLDVDVQFEEDAVPYFGIGWGNPSSSDRFTFTVDLGVVNVGSPDIGMTFSCINALLCATIDADVAAEIQQLEDDVEDFEWWPVVTIGFSYRF